MENITENQWMADHKDVSTHRKQLFKNAFKHYKAFVENFHISMLDSKERLPEFVDWMINKGLSNKTINLYVYEIISLYRTYSNHGISVDEAKMIKNHMRKVMVKSKKTVSPVTLSKDLIDKIAQNDAIITDFLTKNQSTCVFYWLFSAYTGLRAADVYKLDRSNSSLEKNGAVNLVFLSQKTQIQLKIPLNQFCQKLYHEFPLTEKYNEHKDASANIKKAFRILSKFYPELNNIVTTETKSGRNLVMQQKKLCDAVTFHTARHSYTRMLLEAEVDVYTAMKLLGHSNIQTTADYYASMGVEKRNNIVAQKLGFLV